jgi:cytochrome c peroxidase
LLARHIAFVRIVPGPQACPIRRELDVRSIAPVVHLAILGIAILVRTSAAQPPPPPPPLGPPPQPAGNPVTAAKANLGKVLFFEEQMSSTRTVACATCHRSGAGGSDPRALLGGARSVNPGFDSDYGTPDDVVASPGVPLNLVDGTYGWSENFGLMEQVTGRKSPPAINAAYAPILFWDGRATGTFIDPVNGGVVLPNGAALESQAVGPPVSDAEMAHVGRDWEAIEAEIASARPLQLSPAVPTALADWIDGRGYPELFAEAFGSPVVTAARIGMAIASYERTLFSNQTPLDALANNPNALTQQEQRGRGLFGAVGCAVCHAGPLLTNNGFFYIGTRPVNEDQGRFVITGNPIDLGAFKVPGLRNVEMRAPYMHGGRFETLEEVVDFYNRGGDFNAPNKSPLIRPLNLTAEQRADLVAFLKRPLTDPRVAARTAPFDEPALYADSDRVPVLVAAGTAGAGGFVPRIVAIEPPFAGNPSFTVGVYGAAGGAAATLVIDTSDPGTGPAIPSVASFAHVRLVLGGTGEGQGWGSVSLAISDGPGLVGGTFTGRWYVEDPAAANGLAVSEAFQFTVFGEPGTASDSDRLPVTVVRLHPAAPNPFNPSTTIRYEVASGSDVRLEVFDAGGRRVRELVRSVQGGAQSVIWDGRDDRGAGLPSGVYFVQLHAGTTKEMQRAVLLK